MGYASYVPSVRKQHAALHCPWFGSRPARQCALLRVSVAVSVLVMGMGTTTAVAGPLKLQLPSTKRRAALEEVPWNQLPPEAAAKIRSVADRPTVYRRIPAQQITCDADLFRFLVRYPEVVVNIWQIMGITKVSAQRTAPFTFSADDGSGTQTAVELVYADEKTHVMFCDGVYKGPLFKKVMRGRCVLVLHSEFGRDQTGATNIVSHLDMFLQVDDLGLDVLARTLHPLVGKSADRNFSESMEFVQRVHRTAVENGPGMQRLAKRMKNVQPQVRNTFASLSMQVHEGVRQSPELRSDPQIAARPAVSQHSGPQMRSKTRNTR